MKSQGAHEEHMRAEDSWEHELLERSGGRRSIKRTEREWAKRYSMIRAVSYHRRQGSEEV